MRHGSRGLSPESETAMKYYSKSDGKIYQTHPEFSKASSHQPKGWVETVAGYLRESRQWAICINRNRRQMGYGYSWAVHINHNDELSPEIITEIWSKACRILRKRKIVCIWVREPNRLNKVHYHLIVKSPVRKKDLASAIEAAMPPRSKYRWRKRIERIKNQYRLANYVVKSKVPGVNRNGLYVKDLYREKRLLFCENIGFKKIGTIGDFWEGGTNKKKMWKEIQGIEKKIDLARRDNNVLAAAKYIHEMIGDDFRYPLKKIERSYLFFSDTEAVQRLIRRIASESENPCIT